MSLRDLSAYNIRVQSVAWAPFQEDLGFAAGLDRNFIRQIGGRGNVSGDNVERIAVALDIDPAQ
ncbi:XRE family transcriptional regulator [Burkholderia cepacia]|uniref:XRE family transcriptional regulator n=1 Tax=Burkholderia cepacia TaxID=292 RepID=A0ABN5D8L5_BURCE|nr:XRE family transcriptional regulator [Burkholderia cepacia]ATF81412.1 XRE family transcriptional regulator [Burkholderia cepacia]OUE46502.1 hypothetical protein BZY94_08530 [Burkholderia territorii]QCY08038.1 XRE family transcriptional regulator [Burkholderia cepacia ATCC 25416]RQZ92231.1 XRE family transcriptional regulator [Burkholderia cepacia]